MNMVPSDSIGPSAGSNCLKSSSSFKAYELPQILRSHLPRPHRHPDTCPEPTGHLAHLRNLRHTTTTSKLTKLIPPGPPPSFAFTVITIFVIILLAYFNDIIRLLGHRGGAGSKRKKSLQIHIYFSPMS